MVPGYLKALRHTIRKLEACDKSDKSDQSLQSHNGRGAFVAFVAFVADQQNVKAATPKQVSPDPFRPAFNSLERRCPDLVEAGRWQRAVDDSRQFLATWGAQAEALGWTTRELFGLHPLPDKPHPSFQRLSRYDFTGLIWLLGGRPVVALTDTEAAIQGATSVMVYRKHRKPALGPLGDSLDDMGAA